jgi:hypothetical protein
VLDRASVTVLIHVITRSLRELNPADFLLSGAADDLAHVLKAAPWGQRKKSSQWHGNVVRSKNMNSSVGREASSMAEHRSDLGAGAIIQGRRPDIEECCPPKCRP